MYAEQIICLNYVNDPHSCKNESNECVEFLYRDRRLVRYNQNKEIEVGDGYFEKNKI